MLIRNREKFVFLTKGSMDIVQLQFRVLLTNILQNILNCNIPMIDHLEVR